MPRPTAKALYQIRIGSPYMGHYPDRQLAGTTVLGVAQRPESPFEPPENGCPGAWYRSPFIDSVWPYMRRRTEAGGRVSNPRFDSADWLVQAAVLLQEVEEERAIGYVRDIAMQRAKPDEPRPPLPRGTRRRR